MSWSVLAVNNVIELAKVHIGQILVEFFFHIIYNNNNNNKIIISYHIISYHIIP